MEDKNVVPNNTSADLNPSWHIPRPTLARSSNSSQGSTSSNNSTQSAKSGSLLLTAANLAKIHKQESCKSLISNREGNLQYYLQHNQLPVLLENRKKNDLESASVASSTHFTVVNVNARTTKQSRSFCRKHQLTVLVVTMSMIFTLGILVAVWCLELRAKRQIQH